MEPRFFSADYGDHHVDRTIASPASMEPRFFSADYTACIQPCNANFVASMEPRFFSADYLIDRNAFGPLLWSRASSARITFMTFKNTLDCSALLWSRASSARITLIERLQQLPQDAASMEPRFFSADYTSINEALVSRLRNSMEPRFFSAEYQMFPD